MRPKQDPTSEQPAAAECAPEWLERIAHDIRSPVGVLAQTVGTLRERLEHPAEGPPVDVGRTALLAGRAVRRLELLADRLALHAALLRGPLEMYPQRVDFAGVVHAAIEDIWRVYGRREVVLDQAIADRCDVRGDAPRLERAVAELLVNAVHHARRRMSVTLACEGEPGQDGRRAHLVIEDDGGGVSPEQAAKLFAPRSPSHGGLGIGLVIAHGIANSHHGEVVLESPPGGPGARFGLVLPLLERR